GSVSQYSIFWRKHDNSPMGVWNRLCSSARCFFWYYTNAQEKLFHRYFSTGIRRTSFLGRPNSLSRAEMVLSSFNRAAYHSCDLRRHSRFKFHSGSVALDSQVRPFARAWLRSHLVGTS